MGVCGGGRVRASGGDLASEQASLGVFIYHPQVGATGLNEGFAEGDGTLGRGVGRKRISHELDGGDESPKCGEVAGEFLGRRFGGDEGLEFDPSLIEKGGRIVLFSAGQEKTGLLDLGAELRDEPELIGRVLGEEGVADFEAALEALEGGGKVAGDGLNFSDEVEALRELMSPFGDGGVSQGESDETGGHFLKVGECPGVVAIVLSREAEPRGDVGEIKLEFPVLGIGGTEGGDGLLFGEKAEPGLGQAAGIEVDDRKIVVPVDEFALAAQGGAFDLGEGEGGVTVVSEPLAHCIEFPPTSGDEADPIF